MPKHIKGIRTYANYQKAGYEHMYRKHPHITRELIKEYHEDVICLSACISGEVPQLLGKDYDQKALEAAQWYQSVFGKDYYIEIQHHNIPIEKVINPKLEQLAKRIGSKLVATLIVQDFINFAKNNNIPVGLGRGSAAGSLVACAMNITDIDPIKYGLLFERFLNEDRVSYPDIDSDFSLKDRQKVLEYVKNKYGSNCVSKIIDITRLMPRNAVRDVARVMGYPYSVGDKISKAIPDSAKTLTFSQIPINDPKIYMTLKNGKTSGVFQLESQGMTNMLHEMYYDVSEKDTEGKGEEYFTRLIAAVALYRPGPMDGIPHYIEAMKSGKIKYDVPQLENILKSTYGSILVYQEQIMFAVRALAGFSKGESDNIRRAMGKKHIDEMLEFKKYFLYGSKKHDMDYPEKPINIKGCIANGINENTAKNIWNKMEKFASYAFNKSHACR